MNKEDYDQITSFHYAAYRPPLHQLILKKCLPTEQLFSLGLDVGCGTGQSAIALTHFCRQVIGIEPSHDMLAKANPHPQVNYQPFNGKYFEFEANKFDVITFAGSLYYGKSQKLLDEVVRIGKPLGTILIYDFEINLDAIFSLFKIEVPKSTSLPYNHETDFSGLNQKNLNKIQSKKEKIFLKIEEVNLVHLLLADKDNYQLLVKEFGEQDVEKKILERLKPERGKIDFELETIIYYTKYEVFI